MWVAHFPRGLGEDCPESPEVIMTGTKKKRRAPKVKRLKRPPEEVLKFDDPLLTPTQCAARLGVAIDTLTIWRSTERVALAYTKIGRLVRYSTRDVEAFIAARRVVPAE